MHYCLLKTSAIMPLQRIEKRVFIGLYTLALNIGLYTSWYFIFNAAGAKK